MMTIVTNRILQLNAKDYQNQEVTLHGWVRNNRDQKSFGFLVINDGTTLDTIQAVYDESLHNFKDIQKVRVGSAVEVKGMLIFTPEMKQAYEIKITDFTLLGDSPEDYPIQPKRHSREFLREKGHLRVRTNLFNAVFRLRSVAAYAIHSFFQEKGFVYVNTPIITANDGEGAGQMFNVTTFDLNNIPRNENGSIDYKKDFFGKATNLTVTGQLEAETLALGLRNVYTFGPTFRAENSNTMTHASEFWMVEPEMAFCDLKGDMEIMENMLKYVIKYCFDKLPDEMKFFDEFVEKGLIQKLDNVLTKPFAIVTHDDAITILRGAKTSFENEPKYGEDIAREHEKYLTDTHFSSPVFVTNWPKEIKAFYMKQNADKKTVAAVDLLVPKSGELMGGSQREETFEKLVERMEELKMNREDFSWYLDLRKYGGCVHSGFGMGFERLLIYLTGVENIRDVIPYPRTPKNCEF